MSAKENKISYYVWNSDTPLMADTFETVTFADGGELHANIGKTPIVKGDIIYLDSGAVRQAYTMSGRAYEPEFRSGRAVLQGCPIAKTLNSEERAKLLYQVAEKDSIQPRIQEQIARVTPIINQLAKDFVEQENILREESKKQRVIAEQKRKEMINGALKQMDMFFNRKEASSENTEQNPENSPRNKIKP